MASARPTSIAAHVSSSAPAEFYKHAFSALRADVFDPLELLSTEPVEAPALREFGVVRTVADVDAALARFDYIITPYAIKVHRARSHAWRIVWSWCAAPTTESCQLLPRTVADVTVLVRARGGPRHCRCARRFRPSGSTTKPRARSRSIHRHGASTTCVCASGQLASGSKGCCLPRRTLAPACCSGRAVGRLTMNRLVGSLHGTAGATPRSETAVIPTTAPSPACGHRRAVHWCSRSPTMVCGMRSSTASPSRSIRRRRPLRTSAVHPRPVTP